MASCLVGQGSLSRVGKCDGDQSVGSRAFSSSNPPRATSSRATECVCASAVRRPPPKSRESVPPPGSALFELGQQLVGTVDDLQRFQHHRRVHRDGAVFGLVEPVVTGDRVDVAVKGQPDKIPVFVDQWTA